jgi:hypothetical protein
VDLGRQATQSFKKKKIENNQSINLSKKLKEIYAFLFFACTPINNQLSSARIIFFGR